MNYLQSSDGQQKTDEGLKILESSKQIDDLIKDLQRDRRQMRKVIPYLPEDLRDELLSEEFASTCIAKFSALDKDNSGSLEPVELYPMILEMTKAHQYALDDEQCIRFTAIFDDEKTGVISKKEFLNFARFLMVMSYLRTEDGQNVLAIATEKHEEKKQAKKAQKDAQRAAQRASPPSQSTDIVARGPGGDDGHMAIDLEFYQGKSEKLSRENDALRNQIFSMEEAMRRMEGRMDEQEQRLRHAEIDLRTVGGKLR